MVPLERRSPRQELLLAVKNQMSSTREIATPPKRAHQNLPWSQQPSNPACPFSSPAAPPVLVHHDREQQRSAMLWWAPPPDPAGTSLCPRAAVPAQPSHPCRAWHLLRKQVVLQTWPQTLLLLVPKGAGQDGCRTVLLVREFSAIKLPSTTLEQLIFRARGSIIIPSIHSCERTRANHGSSPIKALLL